MNLLLSRAALLLLLAAPLVACDRPAGSEPDGDPKAARPAAPRVKFTSLPAGVTPDMVGEGEELFATACVACHGAEAAGTQLAPSLQDDEWIQVDGSYSEIVALIKNGVANPEQHPVPMPPRGGGDFGDAEVRALAAYVVTLRERSPAPE